MRAIVIAAALLGCLSGPCSAYDVETLKGQAICDTLIQFEELSIAIGMQDDQYIEEMGGKLEKIVINNLEEATFFARLHIRRDGKVVVIPAGITVFKVSADGKLDFVRKYDLDVGKLTQWWSGMIPLA